MIATTNALNRIFRMYNGEVELVYNDKDHRYQVNGTEVPGVTAALQIISKPALIQWAVNECLGCLANDIKPGQTYDEIMLKEYFQKAKVAYRKKKEEAADYGTMVHEWIEKYIKGLNPSPLVNKNLQSSVDQFLKWVRENNVTFTDSERVVYSRKHNFAGTCDFLCEIGGKKYIGDIKTSNAIYDEYMLQTSAYKLALEEETGTQYDGMLIVRVPKVEDDSIEIAFCNNYEKNARAFLSALYLKNHFNLLKALKKGEVNN